MSLYNDQVDWLDSLADLLKINVNEPRNRSGAIQWLIEEHRRSVVTDYAPTQQR